jgi:hypothetical protein
MADVSLQPANITTGSPIISTGEVDNSNVTDWYAYFYEPITYIDPTITQLHSLGPTSFTTSSPEFTSVTLTENSSLTATDILLGQPVVANADLTQDYGLQPSGVASGSPSIASALLDQNHNLSVVAILSGQPVVSSAGLIQNHSFQANDLATGQPVVSSPALTEDLSLEATDLVTGQPLISTVDLSESASLTAPDITTGSPEVESPALVQDYQIVLRNIVTRSPDVGQPEDPNAVVVEELEELKEMFGGWPRRNYEVPDGRLVQAEREIELQFGEKVSIDRKAKSLIKFGKSAPLNTTSLQTVWTVGGNETYVNDNLIDSISSSSALDTQEVYLECHSVDENGDFTFFTQVVTLNGRTRVPLPTPAARVSMAYNNNGTELVGRVVVYENTTLNNGIPTDTSKIHIDIPAGLQESFKGATTFSSTDYFVLTGGFGSVSSKQTGAADFFLEIREKGKVFRQVAAISATSSGPWEVKLDPAVIIPKNADMRVRVETENNNLVVFTVFQGYLAKIL